jgi:hypothetical protein
VADDLGGASLPRRVPGTRRGPGGDPVIWPELSESDLQRIRAALDSAHAEADAPPAELSASLPQRAAGAGNGSKPPAHTGRLETTISRLPTPTAAPPTIPAARSSPVTEETREQPDVAVQPGLATAGTAEPQVLPAPRPHAEQQPGRQAHRDEKMASPGQGTASREKAPAHEANGQASRGKAQLHRTRALTRRPKPAPPEALPPPPRPAPPKSAPPTAPAAPPGPGRRRRRVRPGRAVITSSAILMLVLISGSSVFLLTRHAGTTRASPRARTEATVGDAAAAWVATQVSRAGPVSCDRAMCQTLEAHGVPAADLLVLRRRGAGPLHSAVMVVTPAVTKMLGNRLLTADAPATLASFGSGARRISVRMIYRRGAAAYAAALRKEIADRKTSGASMLLLDSVTASPATRRQLQGGQVDSRLLLTLAELASQWQVTIVAFGDRAPGASPGVPLRSADLIVTGGKTGPASARQVRLMSVFVHQLGEFYAGARIRTVHLANGQDVVRIEFTAPGRFGLLGTPAP